MKKSLLIAFCYLLSLVKVSAQDDPLFTQYIINPMSINPAYVGTNDMFHATMLTRLQWLGAVQDFGAPNTSLVSASMPLASQNVAFGINALRDNFAFNSVTELDAIMAYRAYSGNQKLSFGITVGFVNRSLDFSKLNIFDTGDSAFIAQQTGFKPTFGFGAYYKTDTKYIGFSIPRLTDASIGVGNGEAFKRQAYLTAGMILDHPRFTFLRMRPSVLLKYVENGRFTMDIAGTLIIRDAIFLGVSTRNYNSVNLFSQLQISRSFRVGYSLDLATNNILTNSYGTHEISLVFGLPLLHSHTQQIPYF